MQPLSWTLLLVVRAASADDVVVFGDSWAEGAADELEDVLSDHGHRDLTVDPNGVGGTTAEYWASLPDSLPDAVSANPDARWVWLSIGGNDLFAHYYAGTGAQNAADYDTHLRAMLDALLAAHPDVKVVSFGYDFVNFEQSQECILTAWTYFGTSITTGLVNEYFLADIGGTLEAVAADYPNFTYVESVWGTLQEAGGVAGAPNVLLPSPSEYMSDCIHPTSEGYTLIHEALYDAYWGLDEPTVSLDGATDVCVGDTLELTAATTGAQRVTWWVDGAVAGTSSTLSLPTTTPGTAAVTVRADAGAWDATDEASVTVWAVPTAAIGGPVDAEAGTAATFQVDLADGETAAWSAPGGTVIDGADADTFVVRWDGPGDYVVQVQVGTPAGCAAEAEQSVSVTASGDTDAPDTDEPDADDTGAADPAATECGCVGASGVPPWWVLPLGALAGRRRWSR